MFTYTHVCTGLMRLCVYLTVCVHMCVVFLTNKALGKIAGYFVHLCIELVLIYLLFTPLGR